MLQLRDYQRDAVDSIFNYFQARTGNPCLVAPTSAGKSLIQGTFVKEVCTKWPGQRILCLTHVKELVEQNFLEFCGVYPLANVGVYNAAMKRRDTSNQIIFASIQSIYKKAYELGSFDLVLIDECHLCPVRTSGGMYRTFLNDLEKINPNVKVIGLSATPWRLDDGLLTEGKNRLFTDLIELPNMTMSALLKAGYLSPLVTPAEPVKTKLDVSGVEKRGGDYVQSQLQKAVDKVDVTTAACREIFELGAERNSWLIFATGIEHAEHVKEQFDALGVPSMVVTGSTPKDEREAIVEMFKAQELRALINVNVFTTGFNARGVDLIAFLRPTQSAALYVQMCGRGMRLSPETNKTDCLVLDFAGLIDTHGPVDKVKGKSKKEKTEPGEAPVKECPDCLALLHTSLMVCPHCGYEYPVSDHPGHGAEASTADIIDSGKKKLKAVEVTKMTFAKHEKPGRPPSVRVTYFNGLTRVCNEFVCFEHGGFPTRKAHRWWSIHTGLIQAPAKSADALEHINTEGVRCPVELQLDTSSKYPEIVSKRFE